MRSDLAHTREHRSLRGSAFGLLPWGRRDNLLCNQKRVIYHKDSQSLFIISTPKTLFHPNTISNHNKPITGLLLIAVQVGQSKGTIN